MFVHNFNPVLINLGFFEIRWYSLAYILGILIGWWLGKKIIDFKIKNQNLDINSNIFDDLISSLIISIILGGRLGYVFFYNFSYYFNNPIDILKIWEGGMSFHGALIGIIIGTYLFAKKNNVNIFLFLDAVGCVAPVGLFFGRIANFINGELYGKPTDIMWSVIFPEIDKLSRHPSQIYEALLEGGLLFIILMILAFNKKIKTGVCSSLFLILYGFFRIFSEFFREPDEQIGYLFSNISMGTILSGVMIFAGLFIFFKIKKNATNK
jgi:phosphatidylglycerol:prolipoprotein diacylglycerol transferase